MLIGERRVGDNPPYLLKVEAVSGWERQRCSGGDVIASLPWVLPGVEGAREMRNVGACRP